MARTYSRVGLAAVLAGCVLAWGGGTARAQIGVCDPADHSAEAITKVSFAPAYHIFVQTQGDEGGAEIAVRDTTGQFCSLLVPTGVAQGEWSRATLHPAPAVLPPDLIWNNVGLAQVDTILLVDPLLDCIPNAAGRCERTAGNQRISIVPRQIGDAGDAVEVLLADAPAGKKIKTIITYIDGREAYRTNTLRPVDKRYMRAGAHEVEVHALYTDGTKMITAEVVYSNSEDLQNYYFVYIVPNARAIAFAAAAAAGVAAGVLFFWVVRTAYRKYLWKKEHNL